MTDGDVKKINGEWFMNTEDLIECEECGKPINLDGWINIDDAVKKIIKAGEDQS